MKSECFQQRLCSCLASLFDSSCMAWSLNQPELAKAIAQACNLEVRFTPLPKGIRHFVNGGTLLHRIPLAKNDRYSEILDHYSTYMTQKYPSATFVFDGYDGGATRKNMAQSKRIRYNRP